MYVFHYTHSSNWKKISQLGSGLRAGSYALLTPIPQEWLDGPFPDYWKILKHRIGDILLEINVHPLDNSVFVQDYGHIAGYERNIILRNLSRPPDRYNHANGESAHRAYDKSMVYLCDYLSEKDKYDYALPEVLIRASVPFEHIRLCEKQPLLEEGLWPTKFGKEIYLRRIQRQVPELGFWVDKYKEEHSHQSVSREGRPFYYRR